VTYLQSGGARRVTRLSVVAIMMFGIEAHAQSLGQASDAGVSLWRIFGVLILCCLLAVGAALLLKFKFAGRLNLRTPSDRRLKLVESLRIGPQTQLALVTCDDQEILIASSPYGVTHIPINSMPGTAPSAHAP
jgi:flagellar biogenesis protein FliO